METGEQQARKLADDLRDLAEGQAPDLGACLSADLLGWAFQQVDLWLLPAITSGTGTITKAGRERRTAEAAGLRD